MAMTPAQHAIAVKNGKLKNPLPSQQAPQNPAIAALAHAYLTDPQIAQTVNHEVHAAIGPGISNFNQQIAQRHTQGEQVAKDDMGVYGAIANRYSSLAPDQDNTPYGSFAKELAASMSARGSEEAGFARAQAATDVGNLNSQKSALIAKGGDLRSQYTQQLRQSNFSNAITAETLLGKQALDSTNAATKDAGFVAQWGLSPQQLVGMSPQNLDSYLRSTHRGPYALSKSHSGQLTPGQKADFTAKYGVAPDIFNSWNTAKQQDYLKGHNLGPWSVKGNGNKKSPGFTPNELAGYSNQYDTAFNFVKNRYQRNSAGQIQPYKQGGKTITPTVQQILYNTIHEPSSGSSDILSGSHSNQSGGTVSSLLAAAAVEKWLYGGVTNTTWSALRKRYPGIRGQLTRGSAPPVVDNPLSTG